MNKKSILLPEMKGVMFISGYPGKGKSFLASQADFPPNIAFFDFEDKGEGIHNQLEFGYYKAISQAENNPLARGKLLLESISELEADKYTVVVLDNIKPLEDALMALVSDDPSSYSKLYGKDVNSIIKDSYGAKRGIVNDLISDAVLKPLYHSGIKLVISTSHIKSVFNTPNKMRIYGKDKWQELSILTLILIDGDNHPIPSAIVRKEQLASVSMLDIDNNFEAIMKGDEPSHVITRRLPYRMPECTFQKLRWYLHNPANLDDPPDNEEIVESEIQPFTDQLSKEQLAIQLLALENQKRQDDELLIASKEITKTNEAKIRQYVIETDGSPKDKLNAVKDEIANGNLYYDGEVTIAKIIKWSNSNA